MFEQAFETAFHAAWLLYVVALTMAAVKPAMGRWPLLLGAIVHLGATIWRGVDTGFFPLSNKMESFSAAALSIAIVAVLAWRPSRIFTGALMTILLAIMWGASIFPMELSYPPPPLLTIWYPLHVPLSFLSYALWSAAASAGVAWYVDRDRGWIRHIDRLSLLGFGFWSVSMIFGGIWGAVAWGAYFLWDPKVIWSVILWFHYASMIHVRLTPSLKGKLWVRPFFACIGLVWVFIAYIGTSFLFGSSSHAF